jgi:hypothetical protein
MIKILCSVYSLKWKAKSEGKIPVHAMKAYMEIKCVVILILTLGARWSEWSTSHPGHFILGKESIEQEAGWVPGLFRTIWIFKPRIVQPIA